MPATTQHTLCGRPVLSSLPGGRSLLLQDGPRLLVAKPLPRDCLARTSPAPMLHPHVHDRLRRVRELPLMHVASLVGVEEDSTGSVHLLWQHLPGHDLGTAYPSLQLSTTELARDIVLAVEKLHLVGVVHGALHPRNIIVSATGQLLLTHVSPLVVDDPRRDVSAVLRILRDLNTSSAGGGQSPVLSQILAASTDLPDLAPLRRQLLLAHTARYIAAAPPVRRIRRRSLAAALLLAAFGLLFSLAMFAWAAGLAGGAQP
jgi:hypothetical protein